MIVKTQNDKKFVQKNDKRTNNISFSGIRIPDFY